MEFLEGGRVEFGEESSSLCEGVGSLGEGDCSPDDVLYSLERSSETMMENEESEE